MSSRQPHLFSPSIHVYLKHLHGLIKTELQQTFGLSVGQSRFRLKGYTYPIVVVAFEHPKQLGYFYSDTYELGFNKELQFAEAETVRLIVQHELAHYMTFLTYGETSKPHGPEFRSVCKEYGITDAMPAEIPFHSHSSLKKKGMAQKIAKLVKLGQSNNRHEASQALDKAHELMSTWGVSPVDDDEVFVSYPILQSTRTNQKIRSIANILRSFFVYPLINHGSESIYLEIFGSPENVEVAEYIGKVLDRLIDRLWKDARKEDPSLSGIQQKNSFILGLEEGFLAQCAQKEQSQALVSLENALVEGVGRAYPHLRNTRSANRICQTAYNKGKKEGKGLKLMKSLYAKGQKKLLSLKSPLQLSS